MSKIYIIESPSFLDILDNRNEGEALSKILDLANINNLLLKVSNRETLNIALDKIVEDYHDNDDLGGIFIHFSSHGNQDGIGLSDKSFLNWEDFYKVIKDFNEKIGLVKMGDNIFVTPTILVYSTCDGFNATKINKFDKESVYSVLIGPTKQVDWSSSLIAYSIFYHNVFQKEIKFLDAIKNMNIAIGERDIFQADVGKFLVFANHNK